VSWRRKARSLLSALDDHCADCADYEPAGGVILVSAATCVHSDCFYRRLNDLLQAMLDGAISLKEALERIEGFMQESEKHCERCSAYSPFVWEEPEPRNPLKCSCDWCDVRRFYVKLDDLREAVLNGQDS